MGGLARGCAGHRDAPLSGAPAAAPAVPVVPVVPIVAVEPTGVRLEAGHRQQGSARTARTPDSDYDTHRLEPAGFPLIGGDSDIGFEFGAVGTLTDFGNGIRPYVWNMDLLLAASVEGPPAASRR